MDRLRVCLSVCLINGGGVGGPFEGLSVCLSVCVSPKCGRCRWTV